MDEVRDNEVDGRGETACRWSVDAEDVAGARRLAPGVGEVTLAVGVVVPLLVEGSISPAAVDSLLVKDEIAQPVHDEASLAWGVLMRGPAPSVAGCGGSTVSGMLAAAFLILFMYTSSVFSAWSRIIFSLSMREGQIAGMTFEAQSSSVKCSEVAANAMREALRACTNGSRSERVKAAIRTLLLFETPRFLAIFPRQMVVLVLMPGCSSLAVFARYFSSSPLTTLSESLPMMTNTDLRVVVKF